MPKRKAANPTGPRGKAYASALEAICAERRCTAEELAEQHFLQVPLGTACKTLEPLRSCTELRHLGLSGSVALPSLEPLAELKNLRTIWLRCRRGESLEPLSRVPHLDSLRLSGALIPGLSEVHRDLRSLFLDAKVTDLSPILGLTGLRELQVGGAFGDLGDEPFPALPKLERLRVFLRLRDLRPLSHLSGLQYLEARLNSKLASLEGAKALTSLRHLHVGSTRISDLEPLRGLPLEELDAGATKVSSIEPLLHNPQLRRVNLNGAPLKRGERARLKAHLETQGGELAALTELPSFWSGI